MHFLRPARPTKGQGELGARAGPAGPGPARPLPLAGLHAISYSQYTPSSLGGVGQIFVSKAKAVSIRL